MKFAKQKRIFQVHVLQFLWCMYSFNIGVYKLNEEHPNTIFDCHEQLLNLAAIL